MKYSRFRGSKNTYLKDIGSSDEVGSVHEGNKRSKTNCTIDDMTDTLLITLRPHTITQFLFRTYSWAHQHRPAHPLSTSLRKACQRGSSNGGRPTLTNSSTICNRGSGASSSWVSQYCSNSYAKSIPREL